MRCHICDKELSDPQYNQNHDDFDPCFECLEIIQDVIDSYKDNPSASEDDFEDDLSLEELLFLADDRKIF